ncbi:hypothetical protein SAMN05446037_10345 [Anaerovirgula multivorans]|uniref:Uncharacterized protein n=1 Tax=Anaerovirgula multivorans TaxID=312168 RepID=A0A239J9E8_9FIRM|nr:DUF6033 family protein [Anaerovirgula multivorans]SNT02252.1 hypothetical protein SAMN05446037_10345 [Anaerovirgula multivorans]
MSIGINTNYSNYYSSNLAGAQPQTAKTSQTKELESTYNKNKQMSEQEYLKELQEKYPSLKLSTGYLNTKGPSGTGLGNVVIHPNLLKKMAGDPEFASKVENNIKYIPQGEAWKKSMIESGGRKLVASGCFVDEDGNVSSWSISSTTIGNPEEDEKKERMKELQEKLAQEQRKIEKVTEKYTEQRKQLEEMLQINRIEASTITNLYSYNHGQTSFALNNWDFNKIG